MENLSSPVRHASRYLTDDELAKIERAVRLAESDISGEIVPVFVEKCSPYEAVKYRVGVLAALGTFLALVAYDRLAAPLTDPLLHLVVVAAGGLLAAALTYVPAVGRLAAGRKSLGQVARQKAESIFLQEEIFGTRRRRGVMVFIAFFERCVLIRADKGIATVVPQQVWDALEAQLVNAIKSDQLFEGIVATIAQCGKLMEEHGFKIADDDTDELPNALRNRT
ncbi:MAG: hypothetical protein H7Z75_06945 [Ferruginibacter sp.]|nr:hypothetical protein [Cytophagales bacterium]